MRVLVTGSTGFIGRPLCEELARTREVFGAIRSGAGTRALPTAVAPVVLGDLGDPGHGWQSGLEGMDAVVHLAARVHVMRENASDPLAEFRRVNVAGTERLARAAAAAGVRRFVLMSSIGVNGNDSGPAPFDEQRPPQPHSPYATSKWEAEQALLRIGEETGLEVVVLRPPLVYGPEVPGNFRRLLRLVDRGIPLPFGSVRNRRSMLYLGNLIDAIGVTLSHERAAGETFVVADAEALSTVDILTRLGDLIGRPARLLPVPLPVLRSAVALVGRTKELDQLAGSLTVSPEKLRTRLGWSPPYTVDEGLRVTAAWYRSARGGGAGPREGGSGD